jgi:hypothetical protein
VPLDPSFWIEEPEPFDWKSLRHLAKTISFDTLSFAPGGDRQADMVTSIHDPDKHGPMVMHLIKNRGDSIDDHVRDILDKKMKVVKKVMANVLIDGEIKPMAFTKARMKQMMDMANDDSDIACAYSSLFPKATDAP